MFLSRFEFASAAEAEFEVDSILSYLFLISNLFPFFPARDRQ